MISSLLCATGSSQPLCNQSLPHSLSITGRSKPFVFTMFRTLSRAAEGKGGLQIPRQLRFLRPRSHHCPRITPALAPRHRPPLSVTSPLSLSSLNFRLLTSFSALPCAPLQICTFIFNHFQDAPPATPFLSTFCIVAGGCVPLSSHFGTSPAVSPNRKLRLWCML